jgi:hypothetical protein
VGSALAANQPPAGRISKSIDSHLKQQSHHASGTLPTQSVLAVFASLSSSIQVFTDSPYLDEGRAQFKEAVRSGMIWRQKRPDPVM